MLAGNILGTRDPWNHHGVSMGCKRDCTDGTVSVNKCKYIVYYMFYHDPCL